jgi:GNAT superfamily N-acetyltransferase
LRYCSKMDKLSCPLRSRAITQMLSTKPSIRRATPDDLHPVLSLFDSAIEWFKTFGNDEQWGTAPFSTQPRQIERVTQWLSQPGAWIAELPGLPTAGALVLGAKHDYIPAVDEDEIYVRLLIGSHVPEAKGIGRALLAFADDQALSARTSLLRVDCYNGGSGSLPRFYESCGYRRTEQFLVGEWPGQVLERRLSTTARPML